MLAVSSASTIGHGQEAAGTPDAASGSPPPAAAPDHPRVVPPELVHFEQAPYPEQAARNGIQGDVVLKLTIDVEGNVTASDVVEPAGHGFDEAAREASLKFKWKPALRGEEPVPVQILYRYSFTLTPAEPDTPAPAAPETGTLAGVLRIEATDAPLAGADVVVVAPDGSELRVTTDAEGRFRLDETPPGRYRVRVAPPGFREITSDEEVVVGEATEVVYRVSAETTGIEIIVEGERPPREVTRRTIERREIDRIPGTSGDALRSLESLPGVARPPPFSGLLVVRGSAPEDTNAFFDGSLAPLVYHFGGLSSVVPTELLDRIDFYPGNFSARYGRVMGGIVDVGLRAPDTSCFEPYGKPSDRTGCYHGLIQFDLIDGRLMLQGPVPGAPDWSFALAGRRSWIDAWLKPVLRESGAGVTTAPVYYDYQAILERRRGDSRFSLRAYGSDDRLEILIADPAAQDPAFGGGINFGISFMRLQALYEDRLAPRVSMQSMLSIGKDAVHVSLGNLLFDIVTYPIYLRHEFGFTLSSAAKINAGLDFFVAPVDVVVRAPEPPRPGEPDPGPFVSRQIRESTSKTTAFRPAWYGELELQPTERLRVVPGVRLDFARDTGHADLSPRINARYDLVRPASPEGGESGTHRRRTTLKGGVGVFHQPPAFEETDPVFGTPNLLSERAIHYSIGVEQEFTRQIELSVEGFYKDMTRLVGRAPGGSRYNYGNPGTGSVIGLESLLKYKPDERFFGWVAYTLSRSVRKDAPDEAERLFGFDQTHNLTVLGSYRLGRGWEFGARFRLVSGNLETPVVSPPAIPALYAADAGSYVPLEGAPASRRMPLFHQLDVRIDKRWQFRSFRFSTYLDVQNVYNNAAIEGLVYNYNFSKEQFQTGIPIVPSLGIRGEF